jgi:hypothetical protein
MLPDADDTAKTLYALSFFEKYKSLSAESMVSRFWSPDSFKTYERESTRSISANCNVLKALLALESIDRFIPQIHTAATFICDQWTSGIPYDKWVRIDYPMYVNATADPLSEEYDVGILRNAFRSRSHPTPSTCRKRDHQILTS